MSNSLCVESRVSKINDRRRSLCAKCRGNLLFAYLYVSFAIWGPPAQADQWTPAKGQEKTPSVAALTSTPIPEPEKININRASLRELQSLPGIGEATAKRIVDYRRKNPAFRKVEELLIIRGISKNRLEHIRSMISVH